MYSRLTVIIFLSLYSAHSFANSEIIMPAGTRSENYKYVYIYPSANKEDQISIPGKDGKFIKLSRQIFSREGLYLLKEGKFLWSIEGSTSGYGIFMQPMNDGIHIMASKGYPVTELNEFVFSFYKKGRLIKSFAVEDFCTDKKMFEKTAFNSSDLIWYSNADLDVDNMIYKFNSCNKSFEIDVTTGKVTSKDISVRPKTGILNWFKNFFR